MLADLIRKQLPGYTISGVAEGAFIATKRALFSKQRIIFAFHPAEFRSKDFARQMNGMLNYFPAIPTGREQVKMCCLTDT